MGGQVIHDHNVAGLERRHQDLIEVGQKRVAVYGAIEQPGRGQASDPQPCDEGAGLPVMMRRVVVNARAAAAPAIAAE